MRFSGAAGSDGKRPIVVSYASSPPAEVIFRDPRPSEAPTGVVEDSCFRQIELAGVLRGAGNEDGARELVDFMLSKRFQEDIPLQMFVFPARERRGAPAGVRAVRGRAREPARAPARGDRGEPRALGGRVDGHRGPLSGRAWRALTLGVPLAFLALFFLYPLAAIVERGLRGEGDSPLDVLADPTTREVVWFTVWQALASTAADDRRRAARRLRARAVPLPRAERRQRARRRAVRAADRGRRARVPRDPPRRRRARVGADPVAHAFFNVAVVVRIVGTFWASLDPRIGEAAATLGAGPLRALPRDHRAAARCPRWRLRRQSSSSSRSRRSASSSSSAGRATRRSRRRSTTRPSGSSTCGRRRCSRSFSSPASSPRSGSPLRLERRLAVTGQLRPEGETLRAPRTTREKLVVGASLGGLALFLGLAARGPRRALARCRRRVRARRLSSARPRRRASCSPRRGRRS